MLNLKFSKFILCNFYTFNNLVLKQNFSYIKQNFSHIFNEQFKSKAMRNAKNIMASCSSNFCNDTKGKSVLPTAGIIVIGDEILKGQVLDTNTKFLTEELYKLNVKVEKVSVIPDDVSVIAEEISQFSKRFTHVLTSGGIGPTHDDVTYEGVAMAFGEVLCPHPVIVKFLKEWYGTDDLNSPPMKMAKIPESGKIHFGENKEKGIKSKFPIVSVRNVTIFPGIPHLLTRVFSMVGKNLFGHDKSRFYTSKIYFNLGEVALVNKLNKTVAKFPQVTFGSYPELFHSYYTTKVTLESLDEEKLLSAENYLKSLLDEDSVVDYVSDTISAPWMYVNRLSPPILSLFNDALDTLEQCFERYKPEEVCLCYNGGKDCLVALHITHAYMSKHFPDKRIQAVYITEKNAFPYVTEFVHESINRYDLDCEIVPGPMKTALSSLLVNRPSIKAVIMGTRRVDPSGESLDVFSPTDGDWPPLMRVNPILEWKYDEIWSFIRQLYLPYCSLYDRGYTSLGSLDNTLPNPALERRDALGRVTYLPAYHLGDANLERKGRVF
ncbi:UNVERIFIED_CONTAM: hypothetical protein RMT77_001973 [Armadillidium vulgare]